jgi:transposase
MYCQQWLDETELFVDKFNLQSQRISELLNTITYPKIMNFYEFWASHISENEYLALDITSVSSYSSLINDVESGYNRDGEKLKQINICLLFGENSGLPVFSSLYPGSINDVATLQSFIDQIKFFSDKSYKLVMDKGFHSKDNILYLLKNCPEYKFLLAVPFTSKYAQKLVRDGVSIFDEALAFRLHNDILVSKSNIEQYLGRYTLKYAVFYNSILYNKAKQDKIDFALSLKEEALKEPLKFIEDKEYKKYLHFIKDTSTGSINISLNMNSIARQIIHSGWLVIVTNDCDINNEDIINIYRNKDVVEKAFDRLKNNLNFNRFTVHSDNRVKGKHFISMISLIMISYIHNVMLKNNLYKNYTMTELFKEISKIKLFKCGDMKSLSPISKSNRRLLDSFNIKILN